MYKTHRVNHNFQILYFIAGSCHTPDGVYAILQDLRDDRVRAVDGYAVTNLRNEAKKLMIKRQLRSADKVKKLESAADLLEIENDTTFGKVLFEAAKDELQFIDSCIEKIQKYRKYAHLLDSESHEAAQQEEWKLELIQRAQNYLLTTGSIPTDHYSTMRMHPEFITEIAPEIDHTLQLIAQKKSTAELMLEFDKSFDVIKLLGPSTE